ncbi:glycosyltransferase family 2 protein [Sphingomonas sp. PAMC 26621]|uniref:glycosyltransferase family 2 protein n=1 Tax=Sphingomonas sp. PAMC 26621 TaxID=1112213 RepID=UPI000288AB82|nr:galactosyltransferase-related protein [Sphingomonas sp. PAMC 26621]
MSASVSVLTIVRGRSAHLANLIAGLGRQTRLPDELVVAWMQDSPSPVPETAFPVRSVLVPGDPMPLAAARNRAAEAAGGEQLILLDVDCIPAPTLVERYAATADAAGVRLGDVLYLPPGPVDPVDVAALDAAGMRHPAKPPLAEDEIRPTPSYGELWGLSFALAAADWRRAGGMDERYIGYGGEETDFAARLERAGVTMAWVGGARAYHQHHTIHIPPLQHFDAILRNARLFRATWGRWCMDYWLGQFAGRGMIAIDADTLTILRHPTQDEIAATLDREARFS